MLNFASQHEPESVIKHALFDAEARSTFIS